MAKIKATGRVASALIAEAYHYINRITDATPRYKTWFGAYDYERMWTVEDMLRQMSASD